MNKHKKPTIRQGMKITVQNVNLTTKWPMFNLRCGKCKNWGTQCSQDVHYTACPVIQKLNKGLYKYIQGWDIKTSKDPLPLPNHYIIYVNAPLLQFCRQIYKEYC